MTDNTETTEPKKSPAEKAIYDALIHALKYEDQTDLPAVGVREACATNAEVDAKYASFFRDFHGFIGNAMLAHVLIRVSEQSPRLANEIAHEVTAWRDAGDTYPEWLWQWAAARGIDPEAMLTEARETRAAWLAAEPTRREVTT